MDTMMKHQSYIASEEQVIGMVAALRKLPRANIEQSETGYILKVASGKHAGIDVFRAMVGSGGSYLVRHVEGLFL